MTYAHDASCNVFHLAGPEPCPAPPEATWHTDPDGSRWQRTYTERLEWLENRDGVDWMYAPLPRRRHRCRPQTRGFMSGRTVARCACGATALDGGQYWMERNSRRAHHG